MGMDEASKFMPPTIVRNPSQDSAIMQEEIFGPILPITTYKSLDAIVERINAGEKPLALYIFGREADANEIIRRTSSGGVCVNDVVVHTTSPELPFGGIGASGMGAYHGKVGFDEFSHKRAVMYRATWIDPALRYPPYTETGTNILARVMMGPLIPPAAKTTMKAIGGAAAAAVAALAVRRSRL